MNHDINDDTFESRLRTGVPMVRTAACRTWSARRCACDLDALIDAGAAVLVRSATQAANDTDFIDCLLRDLPGALQQAANDTVKQSVWQP
jgi:hypothetical protein